MPKSLYDQNPDVWKRYEHLRPNVVRMARYFSRCCDLDRALGISTVSSHWHSGRNGISMPSERKAAEWVKANIQPGFDLRPAPEPPAKAATQDEGDLVMFAGSKSNIAKLRRAAAFLGVQELD